jgi:hypothetical protein
MPTYEDQPWAWITWGILMFMAAIGAGGLLGDGEPGGGGNWA